MRPLRGFRASFISKAEIARRAESFRAKFKACSKFPIDALAVAEFDLQLDLDVKPLRELEQDALLLSDFKTLILDKESFQHRNSNRLRFSIAHEFGHLVLHRSLYGNLHFESEEQWIRFIESIPADQYHWVEWQAYEFAGHFLVPSGKLEPAFSEMLDEAQADGYFPLGEAAVLDFICRAICPDFGVSVDVVRRRLESDGLWIPGQMLGPY